MLKPLPMKKVEAVLLEEHKNHVLKELKDKGIIHFINSASDGVEVAEKLKLRGAGGSWIRIEASEQISKIDNLLEILKQGLDEEIEAPPLGELEEVARRLPASQEEVKKTFEEIAERIFFLEDRVLALNNRLAEVRKEKEELQSYRGVLEKLEVFGLGPKNLRGLRYTSIFFGVVPKEEIAAIEEGVGKITDTYILNSREISKKQALIVLIVLKKYEADVSRMLRIHRFEEVGIPLRLIPFTLEEAKRKVEENAATLEKDEREIINQLREIANREMANLLRYKRFLTIAKTVDEANLNFLRTRNTYYFAGWVPAASVNEVVEIIERSTAGACVVEVSEPEDEETPPTLIVNPKVTKPLEALTTTYGTPHYREIDPTSIIAITFPFIFGFMFGDIGQGLILTLIGVFMGFKMKRLSENGRKLGRTLILCGIMATLVGFMYGSMFGLEAEATHGESISPMEKYLGFTIEPVKVPVLDRFFTGALLGGSPEENRIMRAVYFSIYLGIGLLIFGLIINIVNHAMRGELKHGLLSPFGVPGIWALLGGSYVVFKDAMEPVPIALGIGIPILLIFIEGWLIKKEGLLIAFIETFENSMKYLTNTLSFLRITIIGVVHAALSLMMVNAMNGLSASAVPAKGLLIALVFVFGNIIILVMEGFISFVHTLRLHFYEIFSKFYQGNGVLFSPLKVIYQEKQ
ncbi:V-type ATP synthase subunit I [Candidatus Pyrohabitans sp.]